jgi:hypothetical protein
MLGDLGGLTSLTERYWSQISVMKEARTMAYAMERVTRIELA